MSIFKKYLLEIVVFICGAVVMILELAGSRVLAPYLGTSLFVWSSLIGLILGALSLGYWYGGKIADQNPNWKIFSKIILISALMIGLTAWAKDVVLVFIDAYIADIRFGSILSTLILFAPASFMLGMVSPYAVRLKIENLNTSGKTVGNLYAISTLGSIFGTFLAGFILISIVGTTNLIFILSITLAITSLISYSGKPKIRILVILLLFGSLIIIDAVRTVSIKNGLIDVDTAYNRVVIYDTTRAGTEQPVRYLKTDNFSLQSGMFLDSDELVFEYTKFYRIARHFKPNPTNALMIGGAAYTYPRDFLKNYPDAAIDVVEIDPGITELAKKYFGLKDNPRLNIIHEDGRTYLNRNEKKYDIIFGDAFKSYNPPFQLATIEAAERLYRSLSDDGVILMNLISAIEGPKGKLLRAELNTFKQVFSEVQIFAIKSNDPYQVQNLMLVAQKNKTNFSSDDPEEQEMLSRLWNKKITDDMPIMTDDFAPVENYLLSLQF